MRAICSVGATLAVTAILAGCASAGARPRAQLLSVVVIKASATQAAQISADGPRCILGTGAAVTDVAHSLGERNVLFEPRWRDGVGRTVSVFIEDPTGLDGASGAQRQEVVAAMNAWQLAGAPVNFVLVDRKQLAEVRVHWIEKFDSHYEGWTTVSWDHDGWLIGADVELSLRSPTGARLTAGERQQVVTHEFGHVLGLGHSGSTAAIMSPVVKVSGIAKVDAAALSALYSDGGGPARAPDTSGCSAPEF